MTKKNETMVAPVETAPLQDVDAGRVHAELEAVPARAVQLIHGVLSTPALRATLALAGMTAGDLAEGRRRLVACLADPTEGARFDRDAIEARRAALAELNDWDEPGFARFGAALKQHAPSAFEYVFAGVTASGVAEEAVRGIATFLGRIDALEAGEAPPRDLHALGVLEARGLTRDVRERLHALVAAALAEAGDATGDALLGSARVAELEALCAWYDEWAETARALFKKRSDLARLGLVVRKASRRGKAGASSRGAAGRRAEHLPDTERAPGTPLRLYAPDGSAPRRSPSAENAR